MSNLYCQLEERFPDDRNAIFIDADVRETYSYEALGQITARYANRLVHLGVRKGDRVAVQVEKSPEAIFLYLASNTSALYAVWKLRPGDVLLHTLPIFHAHGLFVATNTQLWNGGSMLFLKTFDADRVIDLLPRATVFMGVPTYYVRLLASPRFDRHACRNMRLFVSGSAPLLEDTFHDFQQRTGFTIVERYGMTETVMNTSNPIGYEKAGSVGPPLPGVEARMSLPTPTVIETQR